MSAAPLRVFISYSHADRRWKERLVTDLRALPGQIDVWEDDRIDAGSEWNPEIEKAIAQADIAVLLVSENFLKSPFILEQEVPRLLERRKFEGLKVMPLIVAGEWKGAPPWLAELQVRPRNPERPLSKRGKASSERELMNFVLELWRTGFGKNATAADRRAVRARQLWVDLPTMGYAVLPLMFFIGAVLVALSIRVDTDVQVNAAARTLSFTVGGDAPVQLLNNSTLVSHLIIEDCGIISVPPVRLEPTNGGTSHTGAVRLRCNPDVPGSKVQLRPLEQMAGREIGTLSRVTLQPRDQILVETYGSTRPAVRFEVSRRAAFEFTLTTAPFTIESQYAGLEGTPLPDGAYGITTYLAAIADQDGLRLVKGESRRGLKLVLFPPGDGKGGSIFRSDLDVPLTTQSLVQHDDTVDLVTSTAVTGTLTYPGHPDLRALPIARGDDLALCDACGFTLTSLNLGRDDAESALKFSIRGTATAVRVDGVDRRLTLLDTILVTRTAVVAAAAYVIVAALWLYSGWPRPSEAL